MARKRKPVGDRLMAKVVKSESGCWLFTGTKNGAGYGTIGLGTKEQGKGFVHRVSYEIHHGPIPAGMVVCHKCDVKLCVNPDHLFVGTHNDNSQDAKSKGRIASGERWAAANRDICKGERHGRSKLKECEVLEIIRLHQELGLNRAQLGRQFGISRRMVSNIIAGRNWNHLTGRGHANPVA